MANYSGISVSGSTLFPHSLAVRRLWLVRHGVTELNMQQRIIGSSDVALSEQGVLQARNVGTLLRTRPIVAIYASDLQRASRTADLLAAQLTDPLPVRSLPAWREHDFGDWEKLTYAEVAERYPDEVAFFTDPLSYTPTHGESYQALVERVTTAFKDLAVAARDLPDGDIVLVSHGGALRALLCSLLHMPQDRQWQLQIIHGSLSALDFVPDADDVLETVSLALLNYRPDALSL